MKAIVPPELHHKLAGKIRFNGKIYSSVAEHCLDTIKRKTPMTTLKDIKLGQKCLIKDLYGYTGLAWVIGQDERAGGILLGWKEEVRFRDGACYQPYPVPEKNWLFVTYEKSSNYDEFRFAFGTSLKPKAELIEEPDYISVGISCWNTTCPALVNLTASKCETCGLERPKQ